MNQSSTMHPGMALGGVFLRVFGAIWLAFACDAYPGSWPALAGIAVGALAIVSWALATFKARRRAYAGTVDDDARKRLSKGFMLINAAQWSLIVLAILVLNAMGHGNLTMPAIIFRGGYPLRSAGAAAGLPWPPLDCGRAGAGGAVRRRGQG